MPEEAVDRGEFIQGAPVRLRVEVRVDDRLTDATVTFTVKAPGGTRTTLSGASVTRESRGVYTAVFPGSSNMELGRYHYDAETPGSAGGIGSGYWVTKPRKTT